MKRNLVFCAAALAALSACSFSDSEMLGSYGDYYPSPAGENYAEYEENPFISTAEQPVSTFSVDADGGSYANVRRLLNDGNMPPKNIRTG